MLSPLAITSDASRQRRSIARSMPSGPSLDRPRRVERVGREHVVVDLPELLQLEVAQQRLPDHELVSVLGRLLEQVRLRADGALEAHHRRARGSGRSAGW